jgi:hypothetical protein
LEGFAERARGILGHPVADLGDLLQFLFALRIRLLGGQFGGERGVALGPGRHRITGDDDGIEEWLLINDVACIGERGELRLHFLANAFHSSL